MRARPTKVTASYAHAEVLEIVSPGAARRPPACSAFLAGCGGCQWLHVSDQAQRAAKQAMVAGALRRFTGLELRPILAPAPTLGWRRRARLHVRAGVLGYFAARSHQVLAVRECPQLVPRLAEVVRLLAEAKVPDGELTMALAESGAVALAHDAPVWPGAERLLGKAGIVGVATAGGSVGEPVLELEPGLWGRADAFAQASAEANRAIVSEVISALGPGDGRAVLELYAGAGNLTRALVAANWRVTASDVVAPARRLAVDEYLVADSAACLAELARRGAHFSAMVLDPPRAGASGLAPALAAVGAARIVYVSCDVATLARDAAALVDRGYRALWAQPIDAMPQTFHVETVLVLGRSAGAR